MAKSKTLSVAQAKRIFSQIVDDKLAALESSAHRRISALRDKPEMLQIGQHLISPDDIAGVKRASITKNLYILILKSQPNPEWPIWITEKDMKCLVKHFNIICTDDSEVEEFNDSVLDSIDNGRWGRD